MKSIDARSLSAGRPTAVPTTTATKRRRLRAVRRVLLLAVAVGGLAGAPPAARAQQEAVPAAIPVTAPPTAEATATPPVPVGPPPPPYSLPWQLRPVTVGNVVRIDTATALYQDAMGNSGSTVASMVSASYKLTPEIAPLVRLGLSRNDSPGALPDGSSFLNPIVGATYAHKLGSYKLAAFLATTIPVGMGAGDTPDAGVAAANAAGIRARSAMDNAMFAVNYMTGIAGVGFAYVDHKFTAQIEATLLQLVRVRGDQAASATDAARTNSTAGLHLGYFVIPQLSVGGEVRYQRWLSHPTARNAMGVHVPIADANMDTMTFAVGPRGHFKLSQTTWVRPGISYARGMDAPLTTTAFNVIQVDIPVIF